MVNIMDLTDLLMNLNQKKIKTQIISELEKHQQYVEDYKKIEAKLNQAKQKHRDSEKRFLRVLAMIPNMVFINQKGKIVYVNQRVEEALGYSKNELCSPDFEFHALLEPESRDLAVKNFNKVMKGETISPQEYTVNTKAGIQINIVQTTTLIDYKGEKAILCVSVDDTSKKQVQTALLETERKLTTLLGNLPGMAYRCLNDSNWTMEFISRGCFDLTGYKEDDLLFNKHLSFKDIIHPEDQERVWKTVHKSLKENNAFELKYRIITKSKDMKWVREAGQGVVNENDQLVALESFITDITEQKLAKEIIEKSEMKYRNLYNTVYEGLVLVDLKGTILECNQAYADMLGYTKQEITKLTYMDITPEKWHAMESEIVEKKILRTGHSKLYKKEYIRKDGTIFPIDIRVWLVEDDKGEKNRMWAIIREITKQKQVEDALRESEERFRSLYENSTIGMYRTTPAGEILLANPALVDMLGYSSLEELRQRDLNNSGFEPDYSREQFIQIIEQQGEVRGFESSWRRKDGTIIWIRESARVFKDNSGNVQYYEGTVEEITEKKIAEKKLAESEKRFRRIASNSMTVFYRFMFRPEPHFEYISPVIEKITGYNAENYYDDPLLGLNIIHPDDKPSLQDFMKGEIPQSPHVTRWINKNGDNLWMEDTMTSIKDEFGSIVGVEGMARNITERKQAEERQIQYEHIVSSSSDMMAILDTNFVYLAVNNAYKKAFKLSYEQMIGKTVREVLGEDFFNNVTKHHALSCMEGNVINFKNWYNFPAYGRQYMDVTYFPYYDKNKVIKGFVINRRNITKHKEAEDALAKSDARFKLALENIPDVVVIYDRDFKIRYINNATRQLTGRPESEYLGKRDIEIWPREVYQTWMPTLTKSFQTGITHTVETAVDLPGRKSVFLSISCVPLLDKNGVVKEVMGITRDLTERKLKELDLLRSNRAFRLISKCNLSLVRAQDEVQLLNEMCNNFVDYGDYKFAWIGYKMEDEKKTIKVMAKSGAEHEFFRSIKSSWGDDIYGQGPAGISIRTGKPWIVRDISIDPKYEPWREEAIKRGYASSISVPILDNDNVYGVINIYCNRVDPFEKNEVTLLKELAIDIAFGIKSIRTRNERSKALDEAEHANKVKTLFLANMSHEIRTPLNSIIGFSELLREAILDKIGDEEKYFFDTIQKSGQRLIRTVHEILDMSLLESETFEITLRELDLKSIVNQVISELKENAEEKGLEIKFVSKIDKLHIWADEYSITQAVSNILDNAIKYTIKGSVNIWVDRADGNIQLFVEDTGIGMTRGFQKKMYEVFTQESEGYTKEYQGLGLGLSLTKRYLDINQARIEVESTRGVGTKITISFPNIGSAQ